MFNHVLVDSDKSVIVLAASVIGTFVITLFIGIILGLLCGMKHMHKKLNNANPKESIHMPEEKIIKGPVYEEVNLEDKTTTIDLSRNIAYGQVKKTLY